MGFRENPPLKEYTPTEQFRRKTGMPRGTRYRLSDATGNTVMTDPTGQNWLYIAATGHVEKMAPKAAVLPPPSPKPSTVNDRPALIDDVEDEDDRDLAQMIANITFKGSMTPQDIVALIRKQGWVPAADHHRTVVELNEAHAELYKYTHGTIAPSEVGADQAKMRVIRGGRMAGKTTLMNEMTMYSGVPDASASMIEELISRDRAY